eukprot:UN08068
MTGLSCAHIPAIILSRLYAVTMACSSGILSIMICRRTQNDENKYFAYSEYVNLTSGKATL